MPVQIFSCTLEGLGNIPKNADRSFQYLLVRLLLGTATVSRGNIRSKQTIDYSTLPALKQTKLPASAVKDFLTSYAIGGSVSRFIKVTLGDNRDFYKEMLLEFINFELQTQRGNNTAAFVFLYRILERMSYFVPLLYTSTQTDYRGTFNDLKDILKNVDGELGLFKKLLQKGKFIDPLKLQIRQKILFSSKTGNGLSHFNLTHKRCSAFITSDPLNQEIEIKFIDIPSLLTTLRNRFFHARTGDGKDNVTTIEMSDSDEYFGKINPIIISFLSIVILQTFSAKYHI